MKVELWAIDRVKPYEKNARVIPQKAIDKVAASIKEFGFRQAIVVDKKGVICCGHTRWLAAKQLGMKKVPVHVATDLTPAQIRAYRLADNRTNQETDWDLPLLNAEMLELKDLGAIDMELTGFDLAELEKMWAPGEAEDARANEAPPVPENPVSRLADLWLLGEHRAICGSCENPEVIARLIVDPLPRLMVTDPPYGISLDMEWRDRAGHNQMGPANKSYMKIAMDGKGISGDTQADWSDAFALVPSVHIAYVWHATSHLVEVAQGLKRIGFEVRQQIIWDKTVAAMSRSAYHWKHEPCWYAVKDGTTATWIGSKDQTTVWEAASPKHIMSGSKEERLPHPTQKPVELMRRSIVNHIKRGESVYEPFLGSGTTLAAAQMTGRICYGVEIEPRYVDVVVQRWQKFTGKHATLDGDGRTFEAIAAERQPALAVA